MKTIMPKTAIRPFLLAGRATFTLLSRKTGERRTFRFKRARKHSATFYCQLLNGPDNQNSYRTIGQVFVDQRGNFRFHRYASKINADTIPVKALEFFLALVNTGKDHKDLELYPSGRCGRCNRLLTVPESIITGLGPHCSGRK